uniref:GIY-YIG domain-containing protein n=1 Tax=Meloidogyne incognita TaxID=6306 RepID=A0A914L3J9_MELIC
MGFSGYVMSVNRVNPLCDCFFNGRLFFSLFSFSLFYLFSPIISFLLWFCGLLCIHNITIDTTNFVKNLKKRRGRALVYLVRNGVEIKNLIYVGVSKDFEKRFSREHRWNKNFDGYDKLEKATLIESIETDKSYLLESLLILSDNNSNLVNKKHEYNNFLRFIEYRPTGIEEQVAHLHTLAVKFLLEQWNLITWVPFERN